MRIYDGSPRQDFEEVLRSIGAFLDQRGMRDVLLLEAPDGFIVQGLVTEAQVGGELAGRETKETLTFLDDDIARFMDEAMARRNAGPENAPQPDWSRSGYYEGAFRILGRWIDEQKPHDIFFFEQGGAFVVRLHHVSGSGGQHVLAEFTREDIESLIAQGPQLRH